MYYPLMPLIFRLKINESIILLHIFAAGRQCCRQKAPRKYTNKSIRYSYVGHRKVFTVEYKFTTEYFSLKTR